MEKYSSREVSHQNVKSQRNLLREISHIISTTMPSRAKRFAIYLDGQSAGYWRQSPAGWSFCGQLPTNGDQYGDMGDKDSPGAAQKHLLQVAELAQRLRETTLHTSLRCLSIHLQLTHTSMNMVRTPASIVCSVSWTGLSGRPKAQHLPQWLADTLIYVWTKAHSFLKGIMRPDMY